MNTMYRRRTQLSVVAVAALAIVALAAVMLLAGGAPARADTVASTPGGSPPVPHQATTPTPTPPRHAPPPACPKDAAAVVDSGHIALFDVWWNDDELELTNTSCPPTIEYVPETPASGFDPLVPARTDRSASSIDIDTTIIHIPNSAKVDLNAANTPYPEGKYAELWKADALEDRDTNGDGEPVDGKGDGLVWALPACPPDGTAADDDLCIAFSAALLNPADWVKGSEIEYLLDHVHQIDIDKQDPRYTLAYDIPTDGSSEPDLLWNSSDVRIVNMKVAPGKYERPTLFFTSRGTYQLQVHINGVPSHKTGRPDGLDPVSADESVSSDMREYIIHVGAEADLSVAAIAGQKKVSPSGEADFEIAARNNGPETVPSATVDVTLPPGLTYKSHDNPASYPFADNDGDGVWTWDAGSLTSGASKTLVVRTTVGTGTRGQALAVKASISGTEPVKITETEDSTRVVKNYDLPVADKKPGNNTAMAGIAVESIGNVAPMFMITGSVPENSAAGTTVGDPVKVSDSGDTLTFSLTGPGAGHFAASLVSDGVQVAVANGANLDYETKHTYNLVLGVSDGKDANGNADPSVDHTIGVLIELIDVPYKATLSVSDTSANVGDSVTFTVAIQDPPVAASQMNHIFVTVVGGNEKERLGGYGAFGPSQRSENVAGTYTYYMRFWQQNGDQEAHRIETNRVTVTWSNPG